MEVSGQLHAPAALLPQKIPFYTLDRRLCENQSRSGRGGKEEINQAPKGIEPRLILFISKQKWMYPYIWEQYREYVWVEEAKLQAFLLSALDVVQYSAWLSGRFTLCRRTSNIHGIRGQVVHRTIPVPDGNKILVLQPVESHFTD
jgi:hypothetical protein